ncbi:MAG: PIN domain-containing protein [Deltaproteobacteria bacterium CG03_land_8_20_14_0_80_45_14]|jgi:predicted nucleic acid-binding protein|nr:MAG: PIN domain-containing protein [Deltaproteobacteria bacterium CG03_land_8_20_14_0_80_45_14]
MKIYLDLCIYNRPFDDQGQPRIVVETVEFMFLLEKAINKEMTIINSFVLEYENSKSPLIDRRDKIDDLLKIASEYVRYSERLENRAEEIEKRGFMAMDALHIACAEAAKSDFFITCDDLLLRKGKANKDKLKVRIVNLMEFFSEEVFKT